MSEYNKSIFRLVDGKLSEYRCVNLLYIEHDDEYFVCKVSRLLYRICLFVYDDVHAMEKEMAREHE